MVEPFYDNPTKIMIEAIPHPLTDRHHHLFLEDFMLMDKGGTILCLISKDHPLINANSPQSGTIQKYVSEEEK